MKYWLPEHHLVEAVMMLAIEDIKIGSTPRRNLTERHAAHNARAYTAYAADAIAWIESDAVEPWSYLWCCDVLSISPHLLRLWLKLARLPAKVERLRRRYLEHQRLQARKKRETQLSQYDTCLNM